MKLKTKHLAPYLPYNLKCEVLNSGQEKEIGEMIAVYDDNSACFGNIIESEKGFEYIKPILKPMLDFETYFAKIFETNKDIKEYLNEGFITIDNNFINIEDMLTYKPECMPFGVVQLAFKHHFDIFGLIEKGLAIDVNTLSVQNDG